jgi:hypothetical protein
MTSRDILGREFPVVDQNLIFSARLDLLRDAVHDIGIRLERIENRRATRTLALDDARTLAPLLPAIAGRLGSDVFSSADVIQDSVLRRLLPGDINPKRLGRLLSRAEGKPIAGLTVERVSRENGAWLFRVLKAIETQCRDHDVGVVDSEGLSSRRDLDRQTQSASEREWPYLRITGGKYRHGAGAESPYQRGDSDQASLPRREDSFIAGPASRTVALLGRWSNLGRPFQRNRFGQAKKHSAWQ